MKTQAIKQFYETSLTESDNLYEYDRWQKTSQGRASYWATMRALRAYALPLYVEGDTILEIGPGPGTWTKQLLAHVPSSHLTLVDISEQMLAQAKDNIQSDSVQFVQSDILDFSPTQTYDAFFSSRFIEYVPDKKRVAEVIARSLKTGGKGYLVTKMPQYSRPFSKKVTGAVHQGQIRPEDLIKICNTAGLKVDRVVSVTSVFPGVRSGFLDRALTWCCQFLPLSLSRYVSESYAIIFHKE